MAYGNESRKEEGKIGAIKGLKLTQTTGEYYLLFEGA